MLTAGSVPMNAVVDLFKADHGVARDCKIGKVCGAGEGIVLEELACLLGTAIKELLTIHCLYGREARLPLAEFG